ncbi:hypothetical protein OTSUT76_0734 [Orientia tsutsugamushi str. UT76]|uniref:Uncharacterized protein n=1 Tax=Orientia tsutsugamushi TaxID=784 RepID=A0A2U3R6H0_ORITS|nr:hypothetical protein [Orientia tsutsugamushi]KJV93200.1 hypothetical protein OTSUT76_0734 [Orientia tsutsugamushi str. UT76]SPR08813.1 Uncharacterised protein [Orientia tsutsugamushi]
MPICKKTTFFVLLFTLLSSTTIYANANYTVVNNCIIQNRKFPVTISTDGIDNALSAVNILGLINDKYGLSNSIIGRIIVGYPSGYIALLNHEVVGHGRRAYEFGGTVDGYTLRLFSGTTHYNLSPDSHPQQYNAITLAGVQVETCLASRIINQLLQTKQPLNPVTAWSYIFSAESQLFYVLHDVIFELDHELGIGDIRSHILEMEKIYGKTSIRDKIRSLCFLDLMNPMVFASFYTIASGQNIQVPMIPLGQINWLGKIGFMPLVNLILTPYNVLEKRITVHINTEYTPIKIAFGFGKELKSNDHVYHTLDDSVCDSSNSWYFIKKDSTPSKVHDTYYFELSVARFFSISKVDLGGSLIIWRQPELITPVPRHAEIKNGIMGLLNLTFNIDDRFSIFAEAGYKTKGFILDRPVDEGPLINFAIQCLV